MNFQIEEKDKGTYSTFLLSFQFSEGHLIEYDVRASSSFFICEMIDAIYRSVYWFDGTKNFTIEYLPEEGSLVFTIKSKLEVAKHIIKVTSQLLHHLERERDKTI